MLRRESWNGCEIVLGTVVEWWVMRRESPWCVVGSTLWDLGGLGQVDQEDLVEIGAICELASGALWLALAQPHCCGIGEKAEKRCHPRTW